MKTSFAIFSLVFLALAFPMFGELIPANRVISWQDSAGVRGDIPARPTIFANVTQPPYNVVGDGVTDAYPGIQGAINSCTSGKTVYVPAGTYYISAALKIKSGVTLRGAGMGVTTIVGSSNVNMVMMNTIGMDDSYTASTPRNLTTNGLTKGSTNITTSTPHGWVAGDYIMIDQLKNPVGDPPIDNTGVSGTGTWLGREAGTRCIGQWVKIVTAPTPTTATIDPPLYFSYDINFIPQGYKVIGATISAGLEDMTFDNQSRGVRDIMEMDFCVNCWCLRVEMKGSKRRACWMYGGLWNTIRGCKVHDGVPVDPQPGPSYGSDRAYGIFLGPGPSACLIEDNIFHTLSNCIAYEGAASGNVVAYNYMTNVQWTDNNSARMTVLGHGAHPMMNLVEGNWMDGRFGVDSYWGTGSHFTVFRNRIQQEGPPCVSQSWTIDIERRNWYQNIVGNLLGTAVFENTYQLSGASYPYDNGPRVVYRLGYQAVESTFNNGDPSVALTIYRHGNWDSVSNSQSWEASNPDHALPASLYLSSKPSWFTSLAWPPFDPANPTLPSVSSIPAGYRYVHGIDVPLSAVSRKTHGAAGTFDIPLPLTGPVGVECRSGGVSNEHQIVVTFGRSITSAIATVGTGTAATTQTQVAGSQVTVTLGGVPNGQTIIISLAGVSNGSNFDISIPMRVIAGDATGSGSVNSSDISSEKAQTGIMVNSTNFRYDVNVNGVINASDVSFVKSKSGQ